MGIAWVIAGIWMLVASLVTAIRGRRWSPMIALAVMAVATAVGMSAISRVPVRNHPADEQMIREFKEHRSEYEQILAMFRADPQLGRVAPNFTRPTSFFSGDMLPPREPPNARQIDDIRKRCRRLHLEAGIEGYDDKETVAFIRSTFGLSISGSAKGIVWTKERPKLIVEDTDRYTPPEPKSYLACRPIEGNWYVFYDCTY